MLFNSYLFILLFLPLVISFYYLSPSFIKFKNLSKNNCYIIILLIASFFFYGYWNPKYIFLITGSILFNFFLAKKISYKEEYKSKKKLLIIGILFNLFLLGYFKYSNFFIENIEIIFDKSINWEKIVLPIAISFFTFQQIAYLVDVSNNKTKEYSLLNYSIFVSFFPQLIAGPIVYHAEMKKQYENLSFLKNNFNNNITLGVCIFVIGLFKKVIIADSLSIYADPIFLSNEQGNNLVFIESWIGILSYTFQMYFDFSGYSDMAIGLAKIFGINLPFNFNSPFKSRNIIEFWKKWHITLSRFINDYLFTNIAMFFLRFSMVKKLNNFNFLLSILLPVLITFSLSGLWHGASWNFLLWGTLHGMYIVICYSWGIICKKFDLVFSNNNIYNIFSIILTFISVTLAFVPFRTQSMDSALSFYNSLIPTKDIILPNELVGYWQNYFENFLNYIPYFRFNFEGNYALKVFQIQDCSIFITLSFMIVWVFQNSNNFVKIEKNKLIFPQFQRFKINGFGIYFIYILFFYCLLSLANIKPSPYLYFQF